MLSSCSLPTMKYCGAAVRKESLTEYAYFIFCNCLAAPTEKRQEGSVKLLRKRFPDLHKLISHDLSACLTKNALVYGPSHRQDFNMSDLETALNQFCSRNGFDDLPYTAAANSIAAQFKRIGSTRGRMALSSSYVMETALIDDERGAEFESEQLCREQVPDIPDNGSQTDSFTYTDTSFGSGDRERELRDESITPTPQPRTAVTYDADLSSENDAHTSSTILQESCRKKHSEFKRHSAVKKQTIIIPMPGPDYHGPDRIFKVSIISFYFSIHSLCYHIPTSPLDRYAGEFRSWEVIYSVFSCPWQRAVCARYDRCGHGGEDIHGARCESVAADLGHGGRGTVPLYGAQLYPESGRGDSRVRHLRPHLLRGRSSLLGALHPETFDRLAPRVSKLNPRI